MWGGEGAQPVQWMLSGWGDSLSHLPASGGGAASLPLPLAWDARVPPMEALPLMPQLLCRSSACPWFLV